MYLVGALQWATFVLPALSLSVFKNSTYTNPMLPGWHSDPSCIYVAEDYDAFFCATSSFLTFPGLPIYASKDLQNWRLASHVFTRPDQFLGIGNTTVEYGGFWATNIRFHNGTFYAITSYTPVVPFVVTGAIFTTKDPFNSSAWSDPLTFPMIDIDMNVFWDDDGQTYVQFSGIRQQTINLTTGALGPVSTIWTGFSHYIPEGPHVYKKDGYYYLMISEGGTELGHLISIARATNINGPYEGYSGNPILTNRNTTQYFQTVGHGDLFQDSAGNWWGSGLGTRSGPEWVNYPMGREAVLYPVTWKTGEWPILEPVRGLMSGWQLPEPTKSIHGTGPFVEEPDIIDFAPGSAIPPHFLHWRFPAEGAFAVSPPGHPNSLRLRPARANLTSSSEFGLTPKLSLIMRVQTDTLFSYSADLVSFEPDQLEEEAGVTVFLSQTQHLDLGVVLLSTSNTVSVRPNQLAPHLRFRITALTGNFNMTLPPPVVKPIPEDWLGAPIRLQIDAINETHYALSAASSKDPQQSQLMGVAPATILSGGDGQFTGKSGTTT